jgi:hypothetical protein
LTGPNIAAGALKTDQVEVKFAEFDLHAGCTADECELLRTFGGRSPIIVPRVNNAIIYARTLRIIMGIVYRKLPN